MGGGRLAGGKLWAGVGWRAAGGRSTGTLLEALVNGENARAPAVGQGCQLSGWIGKRYRDTGIDTCVPVMGCTRRGAECMTWTQADAEAGHTQHANTRQARRP